MAILYRSNPMPVKGALFVDNPRRKAKPSIRVNRRQFAKYVAKKKGEPKSWRKYDSDRFKKSTEYREVIRPKYLPGYMKSKTRDERVAQQRVSRATTVAAWKGTGKAGAKKKAVSELRKAPLNLTAAEANALFERLYRSPKQLTKGKKRNTSSRSNSTVSRGNPMTKTKRRQAAAKKVQAAKRSKKLLSFAKFRSLYKGCGHSIKSVSRMYKKYKSEVMKGKAGSAPGLGRITRATKKRRTVKRKTAKRKTTKKRASSRKKLNAYQRFVKSKAGKGLSMAKIADMWRKKTGVKKKRKSSKRRKSASKMTHKHSHKRSASSKRKHSHKHTHRKTKRKHAHSHRAKAGSWRAFTKKHSGKGYSMSKMADMYRKAGGGAKKKRASSKRKAAKRSLSLYQYWLRESKAMRGGATSPYANRLAKSDYSKYKGEMEAMMKEKGKTKLQAVRGILSKYKGYGKADKRYTRKWRGTKKKGSSFFVMNPAQGILNMPFNLLQSSSGMISGLGDTLESFNVPLVSPVAGSALRAVAPYAPSVGLLAGGIALNYWGGEYIANQLYKIPYLGNHLDKFGRTAIGGAEAAIAWGAYKMGLLDRSNAKAAAGGLLVGGMLLDAMEHFQGIRYTSAAGSSADSEAEIIVEELQATADAAGGDLSGIHLGALHMSGGHYGDGGAYIIGQNSQALGALEVGFAGAHLGHAAHCPADFSVAEGSALVEGPAAFKQLADAPGAEGKRWGWLMKMLGYRNAQKVAQLPPKKRLAVIKKLKRNAQKYAAFLMDSPHMQGSGSSQAPIRKMLPKASSLGALESASLPLAGSYNAVGAVEGLGYGALMLAGNGY